MKCQILFSGKNKKNVINLSSAENDQRVVKANQCNKTPVLVMSTSSVLFRISKGPFFQISSCNKSTRLI